MKASFRSVLVGNQNPFCTKAFRFRAALSVGSNHIERRRVMMPKSGNLSTAWAARLLVVFMVVPGLIGSPIVGAALAQSGSEMQAPAPAVQPSPPATADSPDAEAP